MLDNPFDNPYQAPGADGDPAEEPSEALLARSVRRLWIVFLLFALAPWGAGAALWFLLGRSRGAETVLAAYDCYADTLSVDEAPFQNHSNGGCHDA